MKKNEDEKNFSLKILILPKLIIEKKLQYFSTELIDYIVKKIIYQKILKICKGTLHSMLQLEEKRGIPGS